MTLAITFVLLLSTLHSVELAKSATCRTWEVPVETDAGKHRYQPYFIALHRCQGGCSQASPHLCTCVAAKTKDIVVKLHDHLGITTKVFKNHTECKNSCLPTLRKHCKDGNHNWNENTCRCDCGKPPQGTICGPGQIWNKNECQCTCNNLKRVCNARMILNEQTCSCECDLNALKQCALRSETINLKTCSCESKPIVGNIISNPDGQTSETKLITSLVVVALLLGTLFIIDLFLMCSKKGFIYSIFSKCNGKQASTNTGEPDHAETGSLTMETDLQYSYNLPNDFNHKTFRSEPETIL